MIESLLKTAEDQRANLFLCGGRPDPFRQLLAWLQGFQDARDYNLVIVESPEVEAENYLRSALRQDPDGIWLDQRGQKAMPLALKAIATGHRLVSGFSSTPEQAWQDLLLSLPPESVPWLAGQILQFSLFLEVTDQASIEAIYQLHLVDEMPQLCLLGRRQGEGWREFNKPQWRSAPQPVAEDFSPLSIPSEWVRPQEPLLEVLRRSRRPLLRRAWAPELVSLSDSSTNLSRFGGRPALAQGEVWPACRCCGQPMMLVAQIDSSSLPQPAQGQLGPGLFQFFYCIDDSCPVEEAWAPHAGNHLARIIDDKELSYPSEPTVIPGAGYGVFAIQGWQPLVEVPDWEELPRGDFDGYDFTDSWAEIVEGTPRAEGLRQRYSQYFEYFGVAPEELAEIAELSRNYIGDKLFGWPHWSQGVEYPRCCDCGEPMQMVLQINNDGHPGGELGNRSCFGQLFAGDGIGHVFRCPQHRQQMTFAWACG